ncbi:peroxisomal biogenesis factor 13 [Calliopsis andreniformis]|uniref:peroxisomal biogenesis factor 13 n=1 Tax=Calliopsis andreniformis TaxID=337506 RepID=UPI003FCE43CE
MTPERSSGINTNQLKNVPNLSISTPGISSPFPPSNVQPGNPPPIPPRQPVQNYSGYSNYRPFGLNYNGYGYGSQYRGFGGFGGYNSYGLNPYSSYNNYNTFGGHSGDVESRFYQYVEDSTRPTFQLIETVLQTFSSMTMLLESTYFALTNSFKAILSVAENIGRLRSTLGQLFSTFALIRFLKWLYRKITRNTGFQDNGSINEEFWKKSVAKIENENNVNGSFWSGFLIFSVFFVVPYMIHKISSNIKHIQMKGKDPKEWHQYEEPMYVATVLYDFVAANNEELSIKAGQQVCLAPQPLQPKNLPGWFKATDNINVGLIPCNYVKVIGKLKKRKENIEATSQNTEKAFASENNCKSNKESSEILKNDENFANGI